MSRTNPTSPKNRPTRTAACAGFPFKVCSSVSRDVKNQPNEPKKPSNKNCSMCRIPFQGVFFSVKRCQEPTQRAQKTVQQELQHVQDSLSRCVLQCQEMSRTNPTSPKNRPTRTAACAGFP